MKIEEKKIGKLFFDSIIVYKYYLLFPSYFLRFSSSYKVSSPRSFFLYYKYRCLKVWIFLCPVMFHNTILKKYISIKNIFTLVNLWFLSKKSRFTNSFLRNLKCFKDNLITLSIRFSRFRVIPPKNTV